MLAPTQAPPGAIPTFDALLSAGKFRDATAHCAREHGPAVGRLCMVLLGNQAEAQEVAQETFLAAFKGMANFRSEGSVRAWLFGIARRQCARRLQRGPRRHLELVVDEHASEEDTGASLRTTRRSSVVQRHLNTLKPSEREVLALRFAGDLSFKELAKVLEISEASARKRASRALMRLRTQIHPEEVE